MAAFPKCSFIEVCLGLANGQNAVISFALLGSRSLILTLSLAQATLDRDTVALSKGYDAVILFVNDDCSAEVGTVEAGRAMHANCDATITTGQTIESGAFIMCRWQRR